MYTIVHNLWLFNPKNAAEYHVRVVDTPGVGGMRRIRDVFTYMPNATAFTCVINSANAGGVQEDEPEKYQQTKDRRYGSAGKIPYSASTPDFEDKEIKKLNEE
ncbi:hypothetical protein DPMN_040722 [Dreissena polymorpha]|uniref:Uncharacterized protein n=1 Tax=Dreissena polymorpha TaxID=45954 RepID=A0A9D4CYU5_DREPO|nr:hypothetical protein DPMN_040722 [Dreissena polymorpha]